MTPLDKILLGAVCAGIAVVAVMYYTGKLTIVCSKKDGFSAPRSGCAYLAETVKGVPDEHHINQLCLQYQAVCGNGSTTAEILSMSTMDPEDPDHTYVNTLQQDVIQVRLDSTKCEPLLPCTLPGAQHVRSGTGRKEPVECPPFLQCNNGSCN
jgi:hypothetical protein